MRLFAALALIVVALFAISRLYSPDSVDAPPQRARPHQYEDPWGRAEQQNELAQEAWAEGNIGATVAHAHGATLAAFQTVPEEIIADRRERAFLPGSDEIDIWEGARNRSAVAQASVSWARLRHGMRPENHDENYSHTFVAWVDSRDAMQRIDEAWRMTWVHWEEREGTSAEEEWGRCTLAWAHAAEAWGYAHDLVDDFRGEVFDVWHQNL